MKEFKLRHPVWFSVLFCLAEVLLLNAVSIPVVLAVLAAGGDKLQSLDDLTNMLSTGGQAFLYSALTEGITAALVLAAAWALGHRSLLHRPGCKWKRALLEALVPLCYSVLIGGVLLYDSYGQPLQPAGSIAAFVVYMLFIGVLEEATYRGVIGETLLQHFGTGRAGLWKSALISSAIFACMHFSNVFVLDFLPTLFQVFFTFGFGMLMAAIYFSTGNLWAVILTHALWDFSAMLTNGFFTGEQLSSGDFTPASAAVDLGLMLLCLVPGALVLRHAARVQSPAQQFGAEILAVRQADVRRAEAECEYSAWQQAQAVQAAQQYAAQQYAVWQAQSYGAYPPAYGAYQPPYGTVPPQNGGAYPPAYSAVPPQNGGAYPPPYGTVPPQNGGAYPPAYSAVPPQNGGAYPPAYGVVPPQNGGVYPPAYNAVPPQNDGTYPPAGGNYWRM